MLFSPVGSVRDGILRVWPGGPLHEFDGWERGGQDLAVEDKE